MTDNTRCANTLSVSLWREKFCGYRKIQSLSRRQHNEMLFGTLSLILIRPAYEWMHWPHFDAILICFELPPPLPPRWFPSLTRPCWLCSSSLYADDLDLSEPPSATPVEVCAGDPFVSHVQASGVFFHWVMSSELCCPVLTLTSLLFICYSVLPISRCPWCSFAICDEQHSVFSLVLLLEAIRYHNRRL